MRGAGLGAGSTRAFSFFLSNLPGVGLEIHAFPVSETRLDWRLNEDTTSLNNNYSYKISNDNNTCLYRVSNARARRCAYYFTGVMSFSFYKTPED